MQSVCSEEGGQRSLQRNLLLSTNRIRLFQTLPRFDYHVAVLAPFLSIKVELPQNSVWHLCCRPWR